MRFLFRVLLAATALVPAATAANAQEGPDRSDRWRGGREARLDARAESRGPAAAPPQAQTQAPPPQPDRQQPRWEGNRDAGRPAFRTDENRRQPGAGERRWDDRGDRRAVPAPAQPDLGDRDRPRLDPGRGDGRPGDRQGWAGQNRDPRPGGLPRDDERRWNGRNEPARDPRFDTRGGWNQPGRNDRGTWNQPGRDDRGAWNRAWRNDRRYDWNGYRATNRSAYRLPRYYAPRGWSYGYQRFSVGATLSGLLWGENYWIEDPYAYRLPAVYGPYRWVRYYDDALLVDIRTGRVVDTVYGIFW